MSGYPPGLEASPHGDALLKPGHDYELRGSEIKEVPNRTGGGMTDYHDVRDALCNLRDQPSGTMGINGKRLLTDSAAFSLAPIFVRALRAEREAGFLRAAQFYYDGGYSESVRLTATDVKEEPITAGVAAMMEKS